MSVLTVRVLTAALVLVGLVGCGATEKEIPPPPSRPVKVFVVEGGRTDAVRTYPGRVDATRRAELAFRVPGRLHEILVREGDLVAEGQVLARLDPGDFEIVLEDRQASFDNAKSNYERGKQLVADGNISRIDFDRMEADYRTTSAALSQAKKDLEYTVLVSPFRGRIAQRSEETYEEITAKQTIFWLQNIDQLDVIIELPEAVVRSVSSSVREDEALGDGPTVAPVIARAEFEGRGGQSFPLKPKEVATKADDQTQTFRVTFTMDAPTQFNVLPGMTATVTLDLTNLVNEERVKWVPVRAVQAGSGLEPRVWVLDSQKMTVAAREVAIGRMSGSMIEIKDGLEGGEEIVAVGAPYLAEGMSVTRMAVREQAVPRVDDPL